MGDLTLLSLEGGPDPKAGSYVTSLQLPDGHLGTNAHTSQMIFLTTVRQ